MAEEEQQQQQEDENKLIRPRERARSQKWLANNLSVSMYQLPVAWLTLNSTTEVTLMYYYTIKYVLTADCKEKCIDVFVRSIIFCLVFIMKDQKRSDTESNSK